jgi:hypothetical protein
MAKTLPKSAPSRSRQSPPAKSARTPVRPPDKTATTKLPLRSRPAPVKTVAAKAPVTKAPAKKAAPAKPVSPRARAAVIEKSPASEAEIISAVAGKLTTRNGGGMTWLSAKAARIETVEITMESPAPEPAIPVEAEVVEEPVVEEPSGEAPAAVEAEPPQVESAVEASAEAPATETTEKAPDIASEVPPVSVVTEAVADDIATVGTPPEPAAAVAAPSPHTAARPAPSQQAFIQALATAARQLGLALVVQAFILIAFCILVKGGVPVSGVPYFLASVIPLFGIVLAVVGYLSFHGTRRLLDQLEHDRLQRDPANPPAPLAPARLFAHQPALIIIGFLIVVWFIIGATVWWL